MRSTIFKICLTGGLWYIPPLPYVGYMIVTNVRINCRKDYKCQNVVILDLANTYMSSIL